MVKRSFDIVFSLIGLIILFPIFLIVGILIMVDSEGSIFFLQERVGYQNKKFKIIKFRTMITNAHKKGLLTIGVKDSRVTCIGFYLRKYKIDEIPQLINVLIGQMSFVGPRPEVEKYVLLYTNEQRQVLNVRPGITDKASIMFIDENRLLAKSSNPEETYIKEVLPVKLKLNIEYVQNRSFVNDLKIIITTIMKIIR